MKLLAIGDIHQAPNLEQIETEISRMAPDRTIFLGNYFDQWGDTPEDAPRTALVEMEPRAGETGSLVGGITTSPTLC